MREFIRNWLGINEVERRIPTENYASLTDDLLCEVAMIQQKIDGIAEAIGITVAADLSSGVGVAVVARDESRLHEAQVISDYVVAAREMLSVQINSLRSTQFLIDSFNRRHTHLNGHLKLKKSDANES